MATLRQLNLALQTIQNFEGLRRNITENAAAYKAKLAAGGDPNLLIRLQADDASQYLNVRLAWHEKVIADATASTDLDAGLVALGVARSEIDGGYAEMKAAAQAQLNSASKSAAVGATADATLAAVTPTVAAMWT